MLTAFRIFLISTISILFFLKSKNGLAQSENFSKLRDTLPGTVIIDTSKHVDIAASVDSVKWINYLQTEFQKVVNKAIKKGIPPGRYNVKARFLVEKDGSIQFAEALNDPGYGVAEGLIAILKSAPRWKPGYRDGKPLRSYHTQPMTFVISDK